MEAAAATADPAPNITDQNRMNFAFLSKVKTSRGWIVRTEWPIFRLRSSIKKNFWLISADGNCKREKLEETEWQLQGAQTHPTPHQRLTTTNTATGTKQHSFL
jgi:hypothetical protein